MVTDDSENSERDPQDLQVYSGDEIRITTIDQSSDKSLSNYIVAKSNQLIRSSYRLTLQEQRLILAAISKLDSRRLGHHPNPKLNQATVNISALEFGATFKIHSKKAYEELKEATDNLFERKISEIDGKRTTKLRWVSKVQYHEGEGWAELTFSQDILPHLTLLREKFTTYKLSMVQELKSTYSVRIFEICQQFFDKGFLRIPIDDFIKSLMLPYKNYTDIKRRVLLPAIKELRAKSNLEIECTAIKIGRSVKTLEFRFCESAQAHLDLRERKDK